jgi:hypothetical protein
VQNICEGSGPPAVVEELPLVAANATLYEPGARDVEAGVADAAAALIHVGLGHIVDDALLETLRPEGPASRRHR